MAATRIVKPIDVFEDGHFGVASRLSGPLLQQLGLDGFEERLNRRIIVAIPSAAHRRLEPMLA